MVAFLQLIKEEIKMSVFMHVKKMTKGKNVRTNDKTMCGEVKIETGL